MGRGKTVFERHKERELKRDKQLLEKVVVISRECAIKEGEDGFIGYLNKTKEAAPAQQIFYEVAHRMLTTNNGDKTGLVHRFGANAIDEGLNKIIAILTPVFTEIALRIP